MTVTTEARTLPEIRESLRPLFDRIAATAAARDRAREIPYDLVAELAASGFTALRIPVEFGGAGLDLREFTELLVDLAAADSNFPQILRAHFLYSETLLHAADSAQRDEWLTRLGSGELLGGAYSERTAGNQTHFSTTITDDERGRLLNGAKFYSTGSLYADWIVTAGEASTGVAHVIVAASAPGVERVDDWNGFGQRLTASGTTRFNDVDLSDAPQLPDSAQPGSYGTSLAQFWHIATLTGIARALHDDTVGYVRNRKRYFSQGGGQAPREDPVIQSVVGEISTARYVTETLTHALAERLDTLDEAIRFGTATDDQFDAVEVEVYRAQNAVISTVLAAASRVFDVGGASALDTDAGWDRHWRNARTLASHNPLPLRLVSIGDYDLNGTSPFRAWLSGIDLRNRT